MLGACGVQMGTRFLSAEECSIHPAYKEKILKANDLCTMVTGRRLGHPVRSLRTPFARNYAKAEYGGLDDEALEALGTGALRKAVVEGDLEEGCFLSGQVAAMVKQVQPAADIVREVMEGGRACAERSHEMGKIAFVFAGQGGPVPRHGPGAGPVLPGSGPGVPAAGRPAPWHLPAVLFRHRGRAEGDPQHPALHVRRGAGRRRRPGGKRACGPTWPPASPWGRLALWPTPARWTWRPASTWSAAGES